jgi:hypothetical membrane protein
VKKPAAFLSLSGLIAPILFTSMTVICASLRPGYSHADQFMSELAATGTSHADLMAYAGFIPSGLMCTVFGISLLLLLPKSILGRIAAVLVIFFGIGVVAAGFYPCDEGCPQQDGSTANMIHNQVSGLAFMSMIVGIFLNGIAFRKFDFWKTTWLYSVASALLATVFMILLLNSLESPVNKGLWQRLLLATIFLWMMILGTKLFNFSRKNQRDNLPSM